MLVGVTQRLLIINSVLILLLLHLYCRIFSEIERNFPVICLAKNQKKKSIKSGAHQIYKNWLTLYHSIYSEKTNKIMKKKCLVFLLPMEDVI